MSLKAVIWSLCTYRVNRYLKRERCLMFCCVNYLKSEMSDVLLATVSHAYIQMVNSVSNQKSSSFLSGKLNWSCMERCGRSQHAAQHCNKSGVWPLCHIHIFLPPHRNNTFLYTNIVPFSNFGSTAKTVKGTCPTWIESLPI